jgi:hypothetical protein
MKNKLLVSVFAMVIASLAFTSCESKSDVMGVCGDMIKETLHKSPRSLVTLDGQSLSVAEYEFLGGVNDNRMVYRTIAFGNGIYEPKNVDTLLYEYGEWGEGNTSYTLYLTPMNGDPYTLVFKGNAFLTPDGRTIGGEGTDNTARVEKMEKVIRTLPNTAWEATFKGEYVLDSIFRDSIRDIFIPPMTFIKDTFPIFDHMDTVSADTTCYYRIELNQDPATFVNTGRIYKKGIRTKYDRATKTESIEDQNEEEFNFNWYFSAITSDAKFTVAAESVTAGEEGQVLSISKYKLDDAGVAAEFLLGGLTYKPYVQP